MRYRPKELSIRIRADLACFTNPAFTVERFSYDVPTPVALCGALQSVFWRQGMRWNIHSISVLAPIQRANVRRNEVTSFGPVNDLSEGWSTQRMTSYLKDVDYLVKASVGHKDPSSRDVDSLIKWDNMSERYLRDGKQFQVPYLGCRECVADIRLADGSEPKPIDEARSLGRMVFDYVWDHHGRGGRRTEILEYEATMEKGVILVPSYEEVLRTMRGTA